MLKLLFVLVAAGLTVLKIVEYPTVVDLSWWWVVVCFFGDIVLEVLFLLVAAAIGFVVASGIWLAENIKTPKALFGLSIVVIGLLFFTGCSQDPNRPSSAAGIAGNEVFRTVCLNGITYYDYDGYKRHAMAPVIDPGTMSFVRCTSL